MGDMILSLFLVEFMYKTLKMHRFIKEDDHIF